MGRKKIDYKEVILILVYIAVIVAYKVIDKFNLINESSLLGIILFFLFIVGITIAYLIFVQKEKIVEIIFRTKRSLIYFMIPFLISALLVVLITHFVQANSILYKLLIILVLSMTGIWIFSISKKKIKSEKRCKR